MHLTLISVREKDFALHLNKVQRPIRHGVSCISKKEIEAIIAVDLNLKAESNVSEL